jgi:uncharacterized repeat protein (TIGR03803 family)
VEGDDGHLYGATSKTLFRLKLNGELTTLVSHDTTNLLNPGAGLIKGTNGVFYGTSWSGGSNRVGSIFSLTVDGLISTLAEFNETNGAYPMCSLAQGADGSLYGTTPFGGEHGEGTVFRLMPSGSIQTLMSLGGTNGIDPTSGLLRSKSGNIYGMTSRGGNYDVGTIFRIDGAGICSTIASFDYTITAYPQGKLLEAKDGNFYGTASDVFRFRPTSGIQALTGHPNAIYPAGSLTQGSDGLLYGTTGFGMTSHRGEVFRMDLSGSLTTVAAFPITTNGFRAHGGLVRDDGGHLYGNTMAGGSFDQGTLFAFHPVNRLFTHVSFEGILGHPDDTMVLGADGIIFGTSSRDVFRIGADYIARPFASFGIMDDRRPDGSLAGDGTGNLFGVTHSGGDYRRGTVFNVSPEGEIITLHSFDGPGGASPRAGLLLAKDGNFYGTTEYGGASGRGTVFRISPAGGFASLASFAHTNGAFPRTELIEGSDGNLYGAATRGGANDNGTIFKMTPSGDLTSVFSFNGTNGAVPMGRLIEVNEVLYGTTLNGGMAHRGVVFGVTLKGELKTLASFNRRNGTSPIAGLTLGLDGQLYGTTSKGGSLGGGNIYRVVLSPQPQLRAAESEEKLTLSWPVDFSDFVLEAKAELSPSEAWRRIEAARTTNAETIAVIVEIGTEKEFLRLVKP